MASLPLFSLLCFPIIVLAALSSPAESSSGGHWQLLQNSIGIVAMHMQLLHNDHVVIFDRTDFGSSNLSFPDGRCRHYRNGTVMKTDCTAHSIEYDVASNTYRPLFVQTDFWCSSGSAAPDGRLIQTGGDGRGIDSARIFTPCPGCDWVELNHALATRRWYSTNQKLPDGRQIIIGGRGEFNYEFYPKMEPVKREKYSLPFLAETTDPYLVYNNLYPFVLLNVDGNLFIFANNRSILFDYKNNRVVKTFPDIPGGDPRNYPSTGSAVLLPLNLKNSQPTSYPEAEVLLCGGAPRGSNEQTLRWGKFLPALNTCGRIKITDPNPQWQMETMPQSRVMSDMLILPNGNVLIINGASNGTAGWEIGRDPVLNPYIYNPKKPVGSRFEIQNPSEIPRMYHSTAILLRDGRILVGGSNAHDKYVFTNVAYPTELRLEAYSPAYLDPLFSNVRPVIISPASQTQLSYSGSLKMRFQVTGRLIPLLVSVTMLAPPFNTHSFSMNQRLLLLATSRLRNVDNCTYEMEVMTPASPVLAPPGFYILFVVHQGIPSEGIWVQIL